MEATQYSFKPERVTKKKDKVQKRDFTKLYNDLLAFQLKADEKKLDKINQEMESISKMRDRSSRRSQQNFDL